MSRTQLRNALAIVCALAILACCFGAATLSGSGSHKVAPREYGRSGAPEDAGRR